MISPKQQGKVKEWEEMEEQIANYRFYYLREKRERFVCNCVGRQS